MHNFAMSSGFRPCVQCGHFKWKGMRDLAINGKHFDYFCVGGDSTGGSIDSQEDRLSILRHAHLGIGCQVLASYGDVFGVAKTKENYTHLFKAYAKAKAEETPPGSRFFMFSCHTYRLGYSCRVWEVDRVEHVKEADDDFYSFDKHDSGQLWCT